MEKWKEKFEKQFVVGDNDRNFYLNTDNPLIIEDFIDQIISERDKEIWKEYCKYADRLSWGVYDVYTGLAKILNQDKYPEDMDNSKRNSITNN